jgi:hypothetical protein
MPVWAAEMAQEATFAEEVDFYVVRRWRRRLNASWRRSWGRLQDYQAQRML